jgi:hypothetical protein
VGFGVWSNVNSWTPTLVSGYFTGNESIVAMWRTNRLFVWWFAIRLLATSTGWGTASSITGSTSAANSVTAINLNLIILVISYLGWIIWTECGWVDELMF